MARWLMSRRQFSLSASFRAAADNSKAYSKTLRLPKTSFPQWCDPQKSELPFREKTTQALYKWQNKNATGPLFVLHDGPPYANGNLHMGHAMNKILKDIINRFHLLQGRRVNYIPGWDCHGLPIEAKTLKEMKKDARSLPPHVIRECAKNVAEREIKIQRKEFMELGILADWSENGTYRTLDKSYELRQLQVFQKMVEKGLIYRNYRPVHYSPSSRSALAEAELEYHDNHVSRSVYVVFDVENSLLPAISPLAEICKDQAVKLLVWTTTPWTLTANMAIAVQPEMSYSVLRRQTGEIVIVAKERISALLDVIGECEELLVIKGSDLVNVNYRPMFDSPRSLAPFKIIQSSHVTPDSGTGLVHCAPAHGAEDHSAFRALDLLDIHDPNSLICHVDSEGCYSRGIRDIVGDELGERLQGRDVLVSGTNLMIEILSERGNTLLKEDRIQHRYPYDWKTNKPIIVTATSQWFADLESIKGKALSALKGVDFYPPESRNRLEAFIRSRSEWCISRQRVWGVPIPCLHHLPTNETILTPESMAHILAVLEEKGPQHWWDGPVSDFIPPALRDGKNDSELEAIWKKGTDTMDVWFDSGSSWSLLAEKGIKSESSGDQAYADICLEGSDQHRGWFQSLLLTAASITDADQILPYRKLITHGMVLDREGKKMSKSLGNVISPMGVVLGGKDKKKEPAYGADVLRFWASSVEFWRDAPLGPTVLAQAAEALRKIRNSARFILGNIGDEESRKDFVRVEVKDMSIADRYVLHELIQLEKSVFEYYSQLNFPRVIQAVSRFTSITLSSLYFDITKDILYANKTQSVERRAVVTVLEQVLERLTTMLAPITPHLAEEVLYHRSGAIGDQSEGSSVFHKNWSLLANNTNAASWSNEQVLKDMTILLNVRDAILALLEQARGQKDLRSSLEAEVDILVPTPGWLENSNDLARVLRQNVDFLKTLYIVSDVHIVNKDATTTQNAEQNQWTYDAPLQIPHLTDSIEIRVRPASRAKCPRCWTYTRIEEDDLCNRCTDALQELRN